MLRGMRSANERITVTLPKEVAERVRATVESGEADSVSGFVADVLTERFREENVERFLSDMSAAGGPVDDEARAWAQQVLRSARGE